MSTKTVAAVYDRRKPEAKTEERRSQTAATTAPLANNQIYPLIDRLCDKLWAAGVTNPISYVEQISYLFFLKMLDEMESASERDARFLKRDYKSIFTGKNEKYRWSKWQHEPEPKRLWKFVRDEVFEFMRTLPGHKAIRRVFEEAQFQIPDGHTLRDCVDLFREINLWEIDTDVKGNLYESLLRRVGTQAQAGQFLTPRHLIRAIVKMVDPQIGQKIWDPAFGTGGFLISAYQHIKFINSDPKSREKKINGNGQEFDWGPGDRLKKDQWEKLEHGTFFGCDVDPHIVRLGMMNLILHGLEDSKIERRDSIAGPLDKWDEDKFEVILANPPFAGSMNKERIREMLPVPSTKTEILFLGLMIESLADGGTCGVIVPEGLLFGSSGAHLQIREKLLRDCDVEAVVSFPGGSFKPYSGVKTSALIFTKGKPTKKVWFYEVTADGFSLDDNRRPITKNDLPDMTDKCWPTRKVTDKSWTATVEQIRAADFNLTANRYKPVSTETVKHDAPTKILSDILKLEDEITQRGNSLLARIGKK